MTERRFYSTSSCSSVNVEGKRERQRKRFLLTILGRVDQVDVDRLWPLLLGAGQVLVVQRSAAPLHRRVLVAGIVKALVLKMFKLKQHL